MAAASPGAPQSARLMEDGAGLKITVRPDKSGLLLGFLRESELHCQLKEGAADGMDVVDCGKPSDADRARIKKLFAEWSEVNT